MTERIEKFAKLLHEAGREAVALGLTVHPEPEDERKFIEWEELSREAQEGRRMQARYILARVEINPL